MRESKYLNNIVEQDHRAVKRIIRPMLGPKTFRCARILLAGIEVMHMIRKGQLGLRLLPEASPRALRQDPQTSVRASLLRLRISRITLMHRGNLTIHVQDIHR
jgi:hypothetical protein